ncbi:hypothetical protein H8705_00770 [Oscillospiraceae bacterium NSJ-64]|uniref:Uncharacterized protein n=1 Tax=Youxingia wuxianensis TaxID=2763678 RepID=A0A926IGD2_9FIRM|nr:hypothetical protein [Youxingia wuxianensis]
MANRRLAPAVGGKTLCVLGRRLQKGYYGFVKDEAIPGRSPGEKRCFAVIFYSRAMANRRLAPAVGGKTLCVLGRRLQKGYYGFVKDETIPGRSPGAKRCFAVIFL